MIQRDPENPTTTAAVFGQGTLSIGTFVNSEAAFLTLESREFGRDNPEWHKEGLPAPNDGEPRIILQFNNKGLDAFIDALRIIKLQLRQLQRELK